MTYSTEKAKPRAVLVGVPTPDITEVENQDSLVELERLANTLGFEVVGSLTQRRRSLNAPAILGEGKLQELARWSGGKGVVPRGPAKPKTKVQLRQEAEEVEWPEVPSEEEENQPPVDDPVEAIIFDCELSPSQLSNLQGATGAEVLDRTGVIVEIFSRHAQTREARLQVEVARLKYLAPRIRKAGHGPSDRKGKAGETSLELDRRNIRDRIAELKHELDKIQNEQSSGRSRRHEQPCVALVGYTNAGKSSLMRALTGSEVLVEDKLFATLGTTVRALSGSQNPRVLVSDTVGFIKKLPHDLVASFRSTLEEAKNAWLLLFVVDSSDPVFRSQLQVTQEVLESLGVDEIPSRLVLNKVDRLEPEQLAALQKEFPEAICLSAKAPADVERLREWLIDFFRQDMQRRDIFVPYTASKALGALRSLLVVENERHDEEGTHFTVLGQPAHLETVERQILELQ